MKNTKTAKNSARPSANLAFLRRVETVPAIKIPKLYMSKDGAMVEMNAEGKPELFLD